MNLLIVLTTVDNRRDAETLASSLIEQRLAACVQISAIDSVYRWQGEISHSPEFRLLIKTVADRYDALAATLRAEHPYELPAIVALPAVEADAAFVKWVREETQAAGD